MNRSEHERLTDELIGEATLWLLQQRGPISIKALLDRLSAMLAAEGDDERRSVLAQIILEMSSDSNGAPSRNTESEQQVRGKDGLNGSNVYPLFGTSQQSRSSKKH